MKFIERSVLFLALACFVVGIAAGAVQTLVEPSAAEQKAMVFNQRMVKGGMIPISGEDRWATVYIPFDPGVTQPDDYAALAKAIDGLPGLGTPVFLQDRRKTTTVPEGYRLMLAATAQMRLDKIPEPPPEP